MASPNQLKLSDFIKSVHKNLRETSNRIGSEEAWEKHCNDEENLKKYADAMKELACQYWEQSSDASSKSRIRWTVNAALDYFTKDFNKFRIKEQDIAIKINATITETFFYNSNYLEKLKLLDVGSCYNPFNSFDQFEVTAIDIAPATDQVFKCDFLSVKIKNNLTLTDKELCELPISYFDIVVFSLFLEYLPNPKQRLTCCEKAYNLLKNEGLLIIITPDSNHVGANAKFMKSWRYVLAKMGFSRIKYEKLAHVHCMVFRKAVSKVVACRWAELHYDKGLFEEIYIPQDFNKSSDENINGNDKETFNNIESYIDFSELPKCNIFN